MHALLNQNNDDCAFIMKKLSLWLFVDINSTSSSRIIHHHILISHFYVVCSPVRLDDWLFESKKLFQSIDWWISPDILLHATNRTIRNILMLMWLCLDLQKRLVLFKIYKNVLYVKRNRGWNNHNFCLVLVVELLKCPIIKSTSKQPDYSVFQVYFSLVESCLPLPSPL